MFLFGMFNIIFYIKQCLTVRLGLNDGNNAEIIHFNKTASTLLKYEGTLLKYEGTSKIIKRWLIYFDWVWHF